MTLTEKAAYLRGLAEGLNLDAEKPETKMFQAIMDVLDDLALTSSDLEDSIALINEQLDAVDEDLDELETFVYDELDDEDEMTSWTTRTRSSTRTTAMRSSAPIARRSSASTATSWRKAPSTARTATN